jgi:hypothetical protein
LKVKREASFNFTILDERPFEKKKVFKEPNREKTESEFSSKSSSSIDGSETQF